MHPLKRLKKSCNSPYNHSSYIKNSNVLKAIYNGLCQVCKEYKKEIEVHHNDGNHNNHDIFNLVHCCKNCHIMIHKGRANILGIKKEHIMMFEKYLKILKAYAD